MITPQQIEQVSFSKASFGGYNMQQVDEFLEPLTEDYVTLYKENALLKSKMRVLATKLEEYRKNGVEAKNASVDAKAAADRIIGDVREDGVAALIEELWFNGPRAEPSGKDLGSAWGNIESAGGSL